MIHHYRGSIVLPACNEAAALVELLPALVNTFPQAEIIVVNDGSTDDTALICSKYPAMTVTHPHRMGNGAAIKNGARAATRDTLIFMDADGQHRIEDVLSLIAKFEAGFDMVVGDRQGGSHAGMHRAIANDLFSRFASWMVNQTVNDLTSGLRIVDSKKFKRFLYLLPNGFSYPTTITMCFFRLGYRVAYVPIHTPRRLGKSHIKLFRDGVRFLLIILKVGTLYSPLKLFLPVSSIFFVAGISYYFYTFTISGRFTNMSALLLSTAVLVFLIGMVSEQITNLQYKDTDE